MSFAIKGFLLEKRILLVIAHPDDEVMFFSPLLLLAEKSSMLSILCLSRGNADGLGETRRTELMRSADFFGIDRSLVDVIEHPDLQDGFNCAWPPKLISKVVTEKIKTFRPDTVITFDGQGISGHPNHIAVYRGVLMTYQSTLHDSSDILYLKLDTTSLFRKFCGIFDLLLSLLCNIYVIVNLNIFAVWAGMQSHESQFVWYRKIFVLVSRYSYVNSFAKFDHKNG